MREGLRMTNIKQMEVSAGCFSNTIAVVHFDMDKHSPADVRKDFARENPKMFESHYCDTCGPDFPDWRENYEFDDELHVEHSTEVCGYPKGYRESDSQRYLKEYGDRAPAVFCDATYLFNPVDEPTAVYF